ncbi:uncharacterized protein METZ01_LOCUS215402, partial [marine metagenome]
VLFYNLIVYHSQRFPYIHEDFKWIELFYLKYKDDDNL